MKDLQDVLVVAHEDKLLEIEGLEIISEYTGIPLPVQALLSQLMERNATIVHNFCFSILFNILRNMQKKMIKINSC